MWLTSWKSRRRQNSLRIPVGIPVKKNQMEKDWQISSAPSSLANDFCTASTSAPFAKWVIRHSLKSLFSCWWLNCRPMTCWPTTSQLTRYLPKAEYLQSKYLVSAFGRSLHSSLGVGQCIIGAQLSHQHEKRLLSECWIIHFAMACTLCCKCLGSFAFLWCKMPMFRKVGMREGGKPLPLAFQYLIFMV